MASAKPLGYEDETLNHEKEDSRPYSNASIKITKKQPVSYFKPNPAIRDRDHLKMHRKGAQTDVGSSLQYWKSRSISQQHSKMYSHSNRDESTPDRYKN